MNEEAQKQKFRYENYIALLEYPAFKFYLSELAEAQESIKDSIVECMTKGEDNLFDKGRRSGILTAIEMPMVAVKEFEKSAKNEENS